MQYRICPECGHDDLKVREINQQEYDTSRGRMVVYGEAREYRCPHCGWIALVEDSYAAESELEDAAGGPLA